ncbi:ESX secretion-associated protein EspG [Pseudonocardia endophytica]|uniref:ESAT-6 protein secretion system EspG family protein n=1 Tax=Pseudonocardia endophytica TaxID=401976 RepID=A0A4V2PHE9_PSEEN|nr:ESX secretion-associated protein EspG [Pseudonocardia endophytica]TCK20476.1 ESAT-6 protein secretion system EspG family protein [Pseudonocardia endophytica]
MPEQPRVATFPATPVHHVLTEAEFDVLWDELRLGPTPVVLRLPSPGRTRAERARIVAAGRDGLRRRGLADLTGPAPGPARLLGLLAAPRRQLELRGWFGRPVRALAAERDGDGALAVRRDGRVELHAAGTPAYAVRTTMPDRAAGRGRAVSLPTDVLADVVATTDGRPAPDGVVTGPSTRDTLSPEDTALVARLVGGSGGRAQVAAVVHDRWGSPHRPLSHLTVLDTPVGRYRLTRSVAGDGTDWSTLAPVDDRGLHALLTDLLDDADAEIART